jgi:hypothetical protein
MEKIRFADLEVEVQKSVKDIDELCELDLEEVEVEAIADRVVTDLFFLQDDDGLQILPDFLKHSHSLNKNE